MTNSLPEKMLALCRGEGDCTPVPFATICYRPTALAHYDSVMESSRNVPNGLHRHAISPCPSNFIDPTEQFSSINSSCGEPIVEFGSHPIRNWNCSDVASLADQINNGPMLFALLEVIQSQRHGFMPSQAAREQQCQ